jgi:dTDP-4-amino-4,6-dideoxygalactose transaminase
LINFAAKRGVIFGDWYRCVIAPCDADLKISGYSLGVCPNAEKYAQMSVNLPTDINISEKNAVKIINIIRRFYQKAKL